MADPGVSHFALEKQAIFLITRPGPGRNVGHEIFKGGSAMKKAALVAGTTLALMTVSMAIARWRKNGHAGHQTSGDSTQVSTE